MLLRKKSSEIAIITLSGKNKFTEWFWLYTQVFLHEFLG